MKGKNILILSAGDNHGAYEVAYNIASYLNEAGYKVELLVKHKTKAAPFITLVHPNLKIQSPVSLKKLLVNRILEKLHLKQTGKLENISSFQTKQHYYFLTKDENSQPVSADDILKSISFIPDLIIAGMIDGFCTTSTLSELYLKTNAKIFMWLVDMAPLTGGCHYSWGCKGYEKECANCPAIVEENMKDMAYKNFIIKQANIKKAGIKVLSGSQWVTDQARNSTFYKNQHNIFNTSACIDTRVMNGNNRDIAKNVFNIATSAKVIFTGSWNVNDPRKGLSYFMEALLELWSSMDIAKRETTYILIAGEHYGQKDFLSVIPFKTILIDYIKDYRLLSLAYQAADIFVCASVEDAGPLMVAEAMACGTPVVGFRMGNVYSMIETGVNGYVADLKDSKDLANGLNQVLSLNEEEFKLYSKNSIRKIEAFASHKVAVKVIDSLFDEEHLYSQ